MVRNTRQREAIQSAFRRADRPLSPGEALSLASEHVPGLGISTVYRTITALVEDGWLKPVSIPGQTDRYETAGREHHHHFHCTACGGVFEVDACPGDLDAIAPPGFKVHDHEVILTGWCRACASQTSRRGEPDRPVQSGHVHLPECQRGRCDHGPSSPAEPKRAGKVGSRRR